MREKEKSKFGQLGIYTREKKYQRWRLFRVEGGEFNFGHAETGVSLNTSTRLMVIQSDA